MGALKNLRGVHTLVVTSGTEHSKHGPRHNCVVPLRMEGGELFQRVKCQQQLKEPVAKLYFYQMLCAVQVSMAAMVTSKACHPHCILATGV